MSVTLLITARNVAEGVCEDGYSISAEATTPAYAAAALTKNAAPIGSDTLELRTKAWKKAKESISAKRATKTCLPLPGKLWKLRHDAARIGIQHFVDGDRPRAFTQQQVCDRDRPRAFTQQQVCDRDRPRAFTQEQVCDRDRP